MVCTFVDDAIVRHPRRAASTMAAMAAAGPPTCRDRSSTAVSQLFGGLPATREYPIGRLCRRTRAAHLRREQRDHEGKLITRSLPPAPARRDDDNSPCRTTLSRVDHARNLARKRARAQ
ncbi:hypothetical protein HBB16_20285 [Pseudonocardia sp. MCCB 268]|nr:hypothetical protein [Pseudonocardia cytotoxica]